jgi:hypothetical protein
MTLAGIPSLRIFVAYKERGDLVLEEFVEALTSSWWSESVLRGSDVGIMNPLFTKLVISYTAYRYEFADEITHYHTEEKLEV